VSQEKNQITGRQIRAARGLLLMSLEDLAAAVEISVQSLSRIETGQAIPRRRTLDALRTALENRGIVFSTGDKPCVCLDTDRAIIPT
jgi:transcriptional regulator with XRE-family HTH domain